jgi:hypothetical protein
MDPARQVDSGTEGALGTHGWAQPPGACDVTMTRKFLADAAEQAYDLDASNLSISCESEEPISSYF